MVLNVRRNSIKPITYVRRLSMRYFDNIPSSNNATIWHFTEILKIARCL